MFQRILNHVQAAHQLSSAWETLVRLKETIGLNETTTNQFRFLGEKYCILRLKRQSLSLWETLRRMSLLGRSTKVGKMIAEVKPLHRCQLVTSSHATTVAAFHIAKGIFTRRAVSIKSSLKRKFWFKFVASNEDVIHLRSSSINK